MHSLYSLRSRLATELEEYLEEQFLRAAAMPYFFPEHLRSAARAGVSGFDSIRQQVFVRTTRADGSRRPAAPGTAYDPSRSRPEQDYRDAFGHAAKEETKPVLWDDTTGDQDRFKRAVILGDPGYGKTWLLRFEARRLALKALTQLRNQTAPLQSMVIPIWMRLPEIAAINDSFEEVLLSTACAKRSAGFERFVRSLLDTDRCVLLLDAWDEVPETGGREDLRTPLGVRLRRFAEQFIKPRILLTSRIVEFSDSPLPEESTSLLELMAFDMKQVESVTTVWFRDSPQALPRIHSLLTQSPQVRGLARIPLMLTLLCRTWSEDLDLFSTNVPTLRSVNRCELFEKCLRGLLGKWNREDKKSFKKRSDAYVSAWKEMLQYAAFGLVNMNLQQFSESVFRRLINGFTQHLGDRHELKARSAEETLAELRDAGLLSTSVLGADSSLIFLHRIFQEYLAACHLVEGVGYDGEPPRDVYQATSLRTEAFPGKLVEKAGEDVKRWWEVVLLAGSELKRRSEARVWELVGALCPSELGFGREVPGMAGVEDADLKLAWLGGQVLLETGMAAAVGLSTEQRTIGERVQKSLGWLLNEGRLTGRERAQAGVVLGRLGDLRPGVGVYGEGSPSQGLPQFDWVPIKAGVFPMGGREGYQAGEQHDCGELKRDFKMSRYPVTVAQYAAFVKAGGYEEGGRRWWTEAGWAWRIKRGITGPEVHRREVFQTGNHPQVGINWFEAVAFCDWATKVLREAGVLGGSEKIALASEAEWERVAGGLRGGVVAWGSDKTAVGERCNCDESQIGATCAVGMFPSGVSEDGLRDLTGNVLEWTRSEYRDYPYRAGDGRELLDGERTRVVRGGSWGNDYRAYLRVTGRNVRVPDFRDDWIGFRCVMMDGTSR